MSIKIKLLLNILVIVVLVSLIGGLSLYSLNSIKEKLFYLTSQSTPYQIKTLEFQKTLQRAVANLVKVSSAKTIEEYKLLREEGDQSLDELKRAQDSLQVLSGESKIGVYDELRGLANELFKLTEEKLNSEKEVQNANREVANKVRRVIYKLKEFDKQIRGIQLNRSAAFSTSIANVRETFSTLHELQELRNSLKEVQVLFNELLLTKDWQKVGIIKQKLNKIAQNRHIKKSKKLVENIKTINNNLDELTKNGADKFNFLVKNIKESLNSIEAEMKQEVTALNQRVEKDSEEQDKFSVEANIANNILFASSELMSYGLTLEVLSARIFIVTSLSELSVIENEIIKVYNDIDKNQKEIGKFTKKIKAQKEEEFLKGVVGELTLVKGILYNAISKVKRNIELKEKTAEINQKIRDIITRQEEKAKEVVNVAFEGQEKAIKKTNEIMQFSRKLTIGVGIGIIIVGVLFSIWIYFSISRPLKELQKIAHRISKGELISVKNKFSRNEIGKVQKMMSEMTDVLRDMVGKIQVLTGKISHNSENLANVAREIEKNSDRQLQEVDQAVTAITEMSHTISDIANNTEEASSFAKKTQEIASKGKIVMEEAMKRISVFVDSVRLSATKIETLGQKSKEINKIVDLIKNIADQINLLALNAAIEAARAGEAGRGFGVVANDIRELAEKTSLAAEEIAKTLKGMETEINKSIEMIEQQKSSTEVVQHNISNIVNNIEDIVRYVEEVTKMVDNTATAIKEQSLASEVISQGMESISALTKELNKSMLDTKKTSEELAKVVAELEKITNWFTL